MTIRMRLILSNLAMLLIPVGLLLGLNLFFRLSYQEAIPNILEPKARHIPFREVMNNFQRIQRQINILSLEDPAQLMSRPFWEETSKTLEGQLAGLVVRKGRDLVFVSPVLGPEDIFHSLPGFQSTMGLPTPLSHLSKNFRLIFQWDFYLPDRSPGSVFLLWRSDRWDNELVTNSTVLSIIFILIMILTALAFTWWVLRSILRPLEALKSAALRIEKEDLDFQVKAPRRDELEGLYLGFESMRSQLQASQALRQSYEDNRRQMIAHIAHDLKTPITAINGYIQGILDGVAQTPEKQARYLGIAAAKARDLSKMADELFFFSSLDVAAVPYDFQRLDLRAFLADLWEEMVLDYATQGLVSDRPQLPDGPVWIKGDPIQLRKVITNLAENAVKFKRGPEVRWIWSLRTEDHRVIAAFADDGRGIQSQALPHIFERFYREDDARTPEIQGTGLGLAIVKKILEDHEGLVTAQSQPGNGTTLFLDFPRMTP